MQKKDIIIIYAEGCDDCERMKKIVREQTSYSKTHIIARYYDCEEGDSVDIALEYGISDIPGCWAFGEVFEGEDFSDDDLRNHLRKKLQ
jgi:hypothetical protein